MALFEVAGRIRIVKAPHAAIHERTIMKQRCVSRYGKMLLAAMVVVCVALSIPCFAQDDDDPPAQAGRISIVNGTVSIQPAGTQDWGEADLNYPIGPGDRIFTDTDGRAEIQVGRTYVRIGPNSDVTFVDFSSSAITFGAAQGALHVRTRGLWENQSLYVQTPSGSTTVTGPADFRVDVYPDQQTAVFTNYDGDVYVSGANDFGMDTAPGQALQLVGTNPVYPQWLQPADQDDLDQWSERRDQQIANAASYRYVSPDAPGAEELDAYGQWSPGTEYGDMWFPTVPAGWAPYRNGHWVNHEPWGWVWVEDEPWGYAPFHYGRWVSYRGRWGWIPGPRAEHPVWSPALVVFAGGIQMGGGGLSVWFPLGPGEPYRPWYGCSPRYVDRVNISNIQETRVVHVQRTYINVTNVTNITYVNRTNAVTVVREQDFAAGRPVSRSIVHVDAQQIARARVVDRPQAAPTRQAVITRPVMRPVPVAVARPTLMNARGLAVAAQPNARPVPPPVRTISAPPALPNRRVIAPPPNVKMTPTARQAMQNAPRPMPQQPMPNRPGQAPAPGRPGLATPAAPTAPGQRPVTNPSNQPRPVAVPAPASRPPAQPQPQTPAQVRPTPTPQPAQPSRPTERPQPYVQPRPAERPAPTPQPAAPVRPAERPVPNPQPASPSRPQERPAPYSQPAPQPRPAERPSPAPRPETRPQTPPAARPAPRPQTPPPSDKNKKPETKERPRPQA